jgi:hypothetical protein
MDQKLDPIKQAYVNVLQFITNNFYTSDGKTITVQLSEQGEDQNYYDGNKIVLSSQLLDAYGKLNLPRFLIYYHELGHHLYSKGMFILLENWSKQTTGPLTWKDNYKHLINWVEDFFIERQLLIDHPYLTDVVGCIRKLPPQYDIKSIEYAFNYWYVNESPTPALQYNDQLVFKSYIDRLLALRSNKITRFGNGILTTLSIKQSVETQFAILIIDFYKWCISRGILPDNKQLPPLTNPNQRLVPNENQSSPQRDNLFNTLEKLTTPTQHDPNDNDIESKLGTSSDHLRRLGEIKIPDYLEREHITTSTDLLKDELVIENRLINKELLDMSQQYNTTNTTIDGLFNSRYKDTMNIQPRVNVLNFFNPNRLVDQHLFSEKQHTYNNVAIYRDISGSTDGETHTLMHHVCEHLMKEVPVDVKYYLYSSGEISILEVTYIPWIRSDKEPEEYENNPLYQQLGGGTNSDAIADVITEQLSDKWLNIIVTDGDLNSLMQRDNIHSLLKNVFVIAVNSDIPNDLLGVSIRNLNDLNNINSVLSTVNMNR